MILEETLEKIKKPSQEAMERCRQHWDSIAKPLHSLGKLEDALVRIAGMTGNERIHLDKKALVVMCADNGVVEEGVTQSGQEVTAIVSENMLSGKATSSIMCRSTGADIFPVDIGIARDTSLRNEKVAYGTKNMAKVSGDDQAGSSAGDRDWHPHCSGIKGKRLSDPCNRRDGDWKYHHQQCYGSRFSGDSG